uniref:Uncharacterized protein n=1 Tax=Haptolina brevifila TaxID=156173 RepID=A0A7S2CUW3_9EUKA|mmetsp:Transcript_29377/g.59138  ORF Transcript_29377/g.59138 Transcript_29377/m.59138 type:complete len:214 (+) Transcript_29377:458-1099(+)
MLRYIAVGGVSTILTGFAYVGLIKIEIPSKLQPGREHHPFSWEVFCFYTFMSLTLAEALFNTFLSSFLVVYAQGLTLRGPPNSLALCVRILGKNWRLARVVLGLTLLTLILSVVSVVWMMLHDEAGVTLTRARPAIMCTVAMVVILGAAVIRIVGLNQELSIPADALVTGDLLVDPLMQSAAVHVADATSTRPEGARIDILNENAPVIPVSRR